MDRGTMVKRRGIENDGAEMWDHAGRLIMKSTSVTPESCKGGVRGTCERRTVCLLTFVD